MQRAPHQVDDGDDGLLVMHVMPDDGRHQASHACWCQPALDSRDPVTGVEVWVHNAQRH